MEQNGIDDDALAERIDRSRATASRLRREVVQPDWNTVLRIRETSGGDVTADDFADAYADAQAAESGR